MPAPLHRPTFKALAKPLRVKGVTRTLAAASVLSLAITHRIALLRLSPLPAMLAGVVVACLVYLASKEALRRDPAFFQIWWTSLTSKSRYDAGKREPVEVRVR